MEDRAGVDALRLGRRMPHRPQRRAGIEEPRIQHRLHGPRSTPARNLFRHILPNSLAPIIVIATTSLASYIVAEATLSFLGVGLPTTTVSWGGDISSAQTNLQTDPMVLFYPSAALAITVLAFIMMGDAVKDALDPKSRTA